MDKAAVGRGDSQLRLPLSVGDPHPPYVGVQLTAPGLTAELSVLEHYTHAFDDLAAYFAELARDWRGWSGIRDWASVEEDLKLSAGFAPAGQVLLTTELRDVHWRASGQVSVDAGEDLSSVAADIAALASAYRNGRVVLRRSIEPQQHSSAWPGRASAFQGGPRADRRTIL